MLRPPVIFSRPTDKLAVFYSTLLRQELRLSGYVMQQHQEKGITAMWWKSTTGIASEDHGIPHDFRQEVHSPATAGHG